MLLGDPGADVIQVEHPSAGAPLSACRASL
jgi:crotonobetainyl-CoA:carnitine CoA-transferase CaiB-like acyl-CoA transferase